MQLLDPTQAKSKKDLGEAEQADRILKLNAEENASVRRVNDAHENEKKEMAEIESRLASFRVAKNAEKAEIEKSLEPLRAEVAQLEERKAKALEPITKDREEADRRLEEATAKEAQNAGKEATLVEAQRSLVERTTALVEREERCQEREQDLDKREDRVKAEEESSKASAEKLATRWLQYHEKVAETNADLARGERAIELGKKTNEVYAEILRKEAGELSAGRQQLADGYRALEQAKIHLGIK